MPNPSLRFVAAPTIAASVAMLLWMAHPILFGQIPFTGDLLHFHYPLRDFYAHALTTGQRFEWMPSLLGGFDIGAEGQLGAYHPFHWLLYRLVPLDIAFELEVLTPYPLLFAGMWLFLRRSCGNPAALFGAMLFTSSGFALQHGVHVNMISVIAHVPWLLVAIDAALKTADWRHRARACAAIALLTGSQALVGHPQALWLSCVIEASYALFLLASHAAAAAVRVRGAVMVAAAKIIGALVGAIQLLGTLEAVRHSTRPVGDATFVTLYSLPLAQLWQLLDPYVFWGRVLRWNEAAAAGDEFAAYGGAVALTLSVWWLVRRVRHLGSPESRAGNVLGLWAVTCGVLGLWLSTGGRGGLYYLQTQLPVVGGFRAPVRYVLLSDLALAVMASLAVAELIRISPQSRRDKVTTVAPWLLALVSAGSTVWLIAAGEAPAIVSAEAQFAAILGPALFVAAALLLTYAARGSRAALAALVLCAAGDQALYGLGGLVVWQDFVTREEAVGYLGPPESRPPAAPHRIVCCPFPDLYELAGYRAIDGYVGLTPVRALDYRSTSALRVADVQYAHAQFMKEAQITGAERISDDWYRLVPPVARARLLTDAQVSSTPAVDLELIDVDRAALVTHTIELDAGTAGTATLTRDDPGQLEVRTSTSGRQLLVISESFNDGWRATVDGNRVQVERVNGDFLGCLVPPGDHLVAFDFVPAYRRRGGIVSLFGLAMALGLLVAADAPVTGATSRTPRQTQRGAVR